MKQPTRIRFAVFLALGAAFFVSGRASAQPRFKVTTQVPEATAATGRPAEEGRVKWRRVGVEADASNALTLAGCSVAQGTGVGVVSVKASISLPRDENDVLNTCVYSVAVTRANGSSIYEEKRSTDDLDCSEPWLRSEIKRHVTRACQLAKGEEKAAPPLAASALNIGEVPLVGAPVTGAEQTSWLSQNRTIVGAALVAVSAAVAIVGVRQLVTTGIKAECVGGDCAGEKSAPGGAGLLVGSAVGVLMGITVLAGAF